MLFVEVPFRSMSRPEYNITLIGFGEAASAFVEGWGAEISRGFRVGVERG
jgi:hypothetical protein